MLRHFLDQLGFKRAVDLVLGAEASAEVFEFLLLFPRQDGEAAGQAEFEVVAGRGGFALLGFGAGGVLCIGLVRGALRVSRHVVLSSESKNAGGAQRLIRRLEILEARPASRY